MRTPHRRAPVSWWVVTLLLWGDSACHCTTVLPIIIILFILFSHSEMGFKAVWLCLVPEANRSKQGTLLHLGISFDLWVSGSAGLLQVKHVPPAIFHNKTWAYNRAYSKWQEKGDLCAMQSSSRSGYETNWAVNCLLQVVGVWLLLEFGGAQWWRLSFLLINSKMAEIHTVYLLPTCGLLLQLVKRRFNV